MTTPATLEPVASPHLAPSAVVWINGREAKVATISPEGSIATCEIDRGWLAEPPFLRHVVRLIGDCERVMILGPSSVRLDLEQEYVTTFDRVDRIVDVEPEGVVDMPDLVERLRTLAD